MFGERTTSTEPDFNLSISPIAEAGILNISEPSPLKKEADTVPLTNTFAAFRDDDTFKEPVILVLDLISKV